MKKFIASAFILIPLFFLLGYFGTGIIFSNIKKDDTVLSESSEDTGDLYSTPMPTPSPTVVVTPTLKPSPIPTRIPTPTVVPQPQYSSEEIQKFIERFAGQYSVDPNVLRHIAVCESGFNPNAINGGYLGLYQFGKVTWVSNRRLMGEDTNPDLRFNAEEAVQTAAYLIAQGRREIWPNCYP